MVTLASRRSPSDGKGSSSSTPSPCPTSNAGVSRVSRPSSISSRIAAAVIGLEALAGRIIASGGIGSVRAASRQPKPRWWTTCPSRITARVPPPMSRAVMKSVMSSSRTASSGTAHPVTGSDGGSPATDGADAIATVAARAIAAGT